MQYNPYEYQLFFIVRKTRKADLLNWIRNNPDKASKLGLDDIIEGEVVKITVTPPPNAGANVVVLGCSSFITEEQRAFWILVKDRVPPAWQDDVDSAIRRTDNRLDFDEWLAGLSTPLYRVVDTE